MSVSAQGKKINLEDNRIRNVQKRIKEICRQKKNFNKVERDHAVPKPKKNN